MEKNPIFSVVMLSCERFNQLECCGFYGKSCAITWLILTKSSLRFKTVISRLVWKWIQFS